MNKINNPFLATLNQHFGYESFRSGQKEVVESITQGKDTLAIFPTGAGKSICFQVPGLMLNGTSIIVSPLISLMKDQVDHLLQKNISASFINSSLNKDEYQQRLEELQIGKYKFIYVAPERLKSKKFIQACQQITISLIVIDEAHCISMWGHQFRPSYFEIPKFVNQLKTRPTLAAFTATATKDVQEEMIKKLELKNTSIHTKSFKRTNLFLHVIKCSDIWEKELRLLQLVKKCLHQPTIIYTATKKSTLSLTKLINGWLKTEQVAAYNGGMNPEKRSQVQSDFLAGKINVIVATNAFGMGIDKPDIRTVIHWHIPSSIENYYQEVGRAGRDQQPSECYLLFCEADPYIHLGLINKTYPTQNPRKEVEKQKLISLVKLAYSNQCINRYCLQYFGEVQQQSNCGLCNRCIERSLDFTDKQKDHIDKLCDIRERLEKTNQIKKELIIADKALIMMGLLQPKTKDEFLQIPGIGTGWVEKWLDSFTCLNA